MKTVRLTINSLCISEKKIADDRLGGTERLVIMWKNYLEKSGYTVSIWPEPAVGEYDLCVHSDHFDPDVKARKHLFWTGGFAAGPEYKKADKVIFLTNYLREHYEVDSKDCEIIPAPFDHELLKYRFEDFVPHRIVSNSNPNRYFAGMVEAAKTLDEQGIEFDWQFCGGNRLYRPDWGEWQPLEGVHPKLTYRGLLTRHEMIGMLTSGQVLAYPGFDTIRWESQGVAFLEAAALGLPVILPKREPFIEVLPEAILCENSKKVADAIIKLFDEKKGRTEYPLLERYDSDIVFERLLTIVSDLIGGPE